MRETSRAADLISARTGIDEGGPVGFACQSFATSGDDKFAGLAWHQTPWGPSLDNVLANVHCEIESVHRAGDHDVVIGRVRQLVPHRDAAPLVSFRGQFGLTWD